MKDEMATNKQHKDGLNIDRDMVYSSKCETTVFEFQNGTYGLRPPPPPLPPPPRVRGPL